MILVSPITYHSKKYKYINAFKKKSQTKTKEHNKLIK